MGGVEAGAVHGAAGDRGEGDQGDVSSQLGEISIQGEVGESMVKGIFSGVINAVTQKECVLQEMVLWSRVENMDGAIRTNNEFDLVCHSFVIVKHKNLAL